MPEPPRPPEAPRPPERVPEPPRPPSAAGARTRPPSTKVRSPGASRLSIGCFASTRVVVGLTPALRVRSRTSRTWSSVISVTTVPDAPARAVRPERCRYALCSTGGSAWMTRATSSTWMPRAAMSVATSVFAVPEWKASIVRVRAPWLRLPCSSTAATPAALSCLASFFARCLVRVNTTVRPGAAVRSTSTGRWSAVPTCSTWCSIVATGDCAESASWVTGSCR